MQQKYVSSINKLLRLHSRKALIMFLNYIEPLPIDIITGLADLNKLILIAFNEGLQIKGLTGSK